VWNCQKDRLLRGERVAVGLSEAYLQGGGFRAFDVGASFIDIYTIQTSPQRRARYEKFPPTTTHVCQSDQSSVVAVVFPVVWNQGKDLRRDLVDGSESVLHGQNQAEHLQRVVFESVDLKARHCKSLCVCEPSFFHLSRVQGCRDPRKVVFQHIGSCPPSGRRRTVHWK